jgi:hypothetical protein
LGIIRTGRAGREVLEPSNVEDLARNQLLHVDAVAAADECPRHGTEPALLVGLVLCMKVYWLALSWRGRRT